MGHVYISYFFKDKDFTDRLVTDLRAAGVKVWRDVDEIAPGQDFSEETKKALNDADALVTVITKSTVYTDYMTGDTDFAFKKGIPIFQITFSQVHSATIYDPQAVKWIDFHNDYNAGLQQLIVLLPKTTLVERIIAPEAPKSKGYVFISFAEEDTDFVTKLREFLKGQGYGYWDYQTSDRNYQTQLFLELEEVIKGAAATISVLSPDWKRSAWAAKEYLFSEEVGTPVFLVMAREMGPTLVTAGIAYIDFVRDQAAGFAKLDRELRRRGL